MFCKVCGKQILDDSVFCQYCGSKQTATQGQGAQEAGGYNTSYSNSQYQQDPRTVHSQQSYQQQPYQQPQQPKPSVREMMEEKKGEGLMAYIWAWFNNLPAKVRWAAYAYAIYFIVVFIWQLYRKISDPSNHFWRWLFLFEVALPLAAWAIYKLVKKTKYK